MNNGNYNNRNNNNTNFGYEPEIKRRYTPEEVGHDKFRKPVTRQHRKRHRRINVGIVLITVVFAVIIGVCAYIITSGNRDDVVASINGETTKEELTTPIETEPPKEIKVTVTDEEMHMGNLILVNYAYPYAFAESETSQIVTVASAKNDNYLVRDNTIQLRKSTIEIFNGMMDDMFAATGFNSLQVNSAYRSYDDQVSTYEYYKNANGEQYAKDYVANPGHSEHHTGLALDLNVNRGGAISYVESDTDCEWFRNNCNNYGFILRYKPEKYYITATKGETWHYRYVGIPHAQIMTDLDLCLEEYTDYLKVYTTDTYVLTYDEGTINKVEYDPELDVDYMIYYVASQGEETVITVPNFAEYEISGNNVDGYVVTVSK
ncbi:MAG: M15 family metallopeptidase [Clostridia bacterium]|nr:M15 family metallopeptidase [Clostridia bacterium]